MSHLRDAGELLAPAVEQTITELARTAVGDAESGAVQLARRYAAAIDGAARCAELAEHALDGDPSDVNAVMYIQALAAKVGEAQLLEKLGPRLLAALESLEATPAARHRAKTGSKPADAPKSKLQALRDTRGA